MGVWVTVVVVLALIPALLTLVNRLFFRKCPRRAKTDTKLSVCIPARNEAPNIARTLEAVLRSEGVCLEVLVGDDHSDDQTLGIAESIAARDGRVRVFRVPELRQGWTGKPHALEFLAKQARFERLVFLDADVCVNPSALARLSFEMTRRRCALLSGFPRQLTESWGEWLLIPHIQFILNGFLPFFLDLPGRSRAFAAGCGQLFLANRDAYFEAGGHGAIRLTSHDGIELPRLFRSNDFATGVVDASDVASCRMYSDFGSVWNGLVKNAAEGMGSPGAILPFSILLVGGQVVPSALLLLHGLGVAGFSSRVGVLLSLVVCLNFGIHLANSLRFRQSPLTALFHPVGLSILIAIQWVGFFARLRGKRQVWKGREIGV